MSTVIGLTGPTGSGKSTMCEFFARHGFTVIDCDKVSREITVPGSEALKAVVDAFGTGILKEDGTLNRCALADLAFASEEATAKLNAATHPFIIKAVQEKIAAAADARCVLLDAPTLIEAGLDSVCDRVVAVLADPAKREKRLTARDNVCPCSLKARMSAGKPDEFYTAKAQDVVVNNADKDTLIMRCTEMFHEYIRIFNWKY